VKDQVVKAPFVQERDAGLPARRAIGISVGRRVTEVVDVEVCLRRLGAHHLDVREAPTIDGGGIRNHRLHREMAGEGRKLLGHVIGDSGRGRRQWAPDGELQARLSVRVSMT
jgi:hypothetical protein